MVKKVRITCLRASSRPKKLKDSSDLFLFGKIRSKLAVNASRVDSLNALACSLQV